MTPALRILWTVATTKSGQAVPLQVAAEEWIDTDQDTIKPAVEVYRRRAAGYIKDPEDANSWLWSLLWSLLGDKES